jgi:hypothetical protein
LYFDCVLNAIVKSGEVVGRSVLGRDVTGQHEKELRFTELFETLQEGAYFSTPDGRTARRQSRAGKHFGLRDEGGIAGA